MTQSKDVKLTIGVPTFNGSENIAGCIESCLRAIEFSERKSVEIVVVDNASTDNTYELVSEISNRSSGVVRVIRNSFNIGLDKNIDKVICEARGDYVKLLGDDDVLDLTFIESLYRVIDSRDFDILLSSYVGFNNFTSGVETNVGVVQVFENSFEVLSRSEGIVGQIASITFKRDSYLQIESASVAEGTNHKFLFIALILMARGISMFDPVARIFVRPGSPRFTRLPIDSLKMQQNAIRAHKALLSHGGPWMIQEKAFLKESVRNQQKYSLTFMDYIHRYADMNSLQVIVNFFPFGKSIPSFYFNYIPRVLVPRVIGNFMANFIKNRF